MISVEAEDEGKGENAVIISQEEKKENAVMISVEAEDEGKGENAVIISQEEKKENAAMISVEAEEKKPHVILIKKDNVDIGGQNKVDILNQENIDLEDEIIENLNKKEKLGGASQKFKLKSLLGIVFEFLEKVLYKGIEKKLDMKKVAQFLTKMLEDRNKVFKDTLEN